MYAQWVVHVGSVDEFENGLRILAEESDFITMGVEYGLSAPARHRRSVPLVHIQYNVTKATTKHSKVHTVLQSPKRSFATGAVRISDNVASNRMVCHGSDASSNHRPSKSSSPILGQCHSFILLRMSLNFLIRCCHNFNARILTDGS